MENPLYQKDILSIHELSLHHIQLILNTAKHLKENPKPHLLQGKIIAHCFFEPSTRTRLSFESATLRLGGQVIGFSSDDGLSTKKGETLHDTMRVISEYADSIVIRHPREGAARLTADLSDKPVINAGDGANQHPTQALIDLFTIQECQERLDGLHIALVGDLKHARAIHSLVQACSFFNIRLYLVSPEALTLPEPLCDTLKKQGVRFSFHRSLEEVLPKIDILYITRIQQERFSDNSALSLKNEYSVTPALLANLKIKSNLKILCPLPRIHEIDVSVDNSPYSYYFAQAGNGVPVRQALLALLLTEAPL